MNATEGLTCEQEGCPFAEDGRCLEGLPNGEGCPHLRDATAEQTAVLPSEPEPESELETEADPKPESEFENQAEPEAPGPDDVVELGGEESLSLAASDAVAAKWGASVVLLAGEHNAGKTTLLAVLYGQFLAGPFAGWSFAGSECLIALDRRYHGARGPGPGPPRIDHTVDDEMRLIDLRLKHASGMRVSLLLSDVKGELVRHIIEGTPTAEEIPLATRADRTTVVIDGEKVAGIYTRGAAISRARVLIGALTDPGGVRPGRPLAILLAKRDCLDGAALAWFAIEAEKLRAFAEERGAEATTLTTAAWPKGSPHRSEGFEDFLTWIVAPRHGDEELTLARRSAHGRSFWRIGETSE